MHGKRLHSCRWQLLIIHTLFSHHLEQVARALLEAGAILRSVQVPPSATLFSSFCTAGMRRAIVPVKAFYEIEIIAVGGAPQIGWASPDFNVGEDAPSGDGVGDDNASWGADGARKLLWHAGRKPWGEEWAAGDIIGCAADCTTGQIWFSKNGVWKICFSGVRAEKLFPALSGSGLSCCIRMGNECMLPPPEEGFVPCPQATIELLRGAGGALLNGSEVPSSIRNRGIDVWLLARGSGSKACAQLVADWAAH